MIWKIILILLLTVNAYAQPYTGDYINFGSSHANGIFTDTRYFGKYLLGASDITVQLALQTLDQSTGYRAKWNNIISPDGNQVLDHDTYTSTWSNVDTFTYSGYDTLDIYTGVAFSFASKETSYTVAVDDGFLVGNGEITFTLPPAYLGKMVAIKNVGGSDVTIDGNAGELIDGDYTFVLSASDESVILVSDSQGWFIF